MASLNLKMPSLKDQIAKHVGSSIEGVFCAKTACARLFSFCQSVFNYSSLVNNPAILAHFCKHAALLLIATNIFARSPNTNLAIYIGKLFP